MPPPQAPPLAPRLRPVDDQTGSQRAATVSPFPVLRVVAPIGSTQDGGAAPHVPAVRFSSLPFARMLIAQQVTGRSMDAQVSLAAPRVLLSSLATKVARSQGSFSRVQSTAVSLTSSLVSHRWKLTLPSRPDSSRCPLAPH